MYANTVYVSSLAAAAMLCNPPPKVENAVLMSPYKRKWLSGSEVTYVCRNNYTREGKNTVRCENGKWNMTDLKCTRTYFLQAIYKTAKTKYHSEIP